MLLESLSWIGKIVIMYDILLKNYILVGLGKIFGRSVKNFGRPGQFWKVWEKIRNAWEKIRNAWKKIRLGFVKFYLAPQKYVSPLKCSPQILRPGAATACTYLNLWREHLGCTLTVSLSLFYVFTNRIRVNGSSLLSILSFYYLTLIGYFELPLELFLRSSGWSS